MTGLSEGTEVDSGELLLPDLLLAAAFARRTERASLSPIAQMQAGRELGGYRILHHLGSGGMGTVYVAEQRHPRRRVALKLLSPTGGSRAMVHRFQQEAQLLGSLQHPGIAQIYEAGTIELEDLGVPLHYLALELVEGLPLEEWVREHRLDLRARLELLARVCDAVEHAHRRGVVHRDLKPANALVIEDGVGGPGQPKVLDFGVARALLPGPEAAHARITLEGQLVGTLAFMSPEQAAGDSGEVDARSDVYALGVLLYRLLCGSAPVDVSGLPLNEATRRIREELPRRPSQRVSGLPHELDTIALKALAKAKQERYSSAAELSGDLRRHLRGEAILARNHSVLYRLGKALRRKRRIVGSASTMVLLSSAFLWVSGLLADSQDFGWIHSGLLAGSQGIGRTESARQLRHSNLDRARLLAMAGHLQVAENLLWDLLAHSPSSEEVLWGLRDLYRRFPALGTYPQGTGTIFDLLALPDGRLVSLGLDGRLREHPPPDFAPRETGSRGSRGSQRLRLTPDGGRLVRLDSLRTLVVFGADSLDEQCSRPLSGAPSGLEGNALECRDDERALVGLDDGRLLQVELRAGGALEELASFDAPVRDLQRSPSGRALALGFADGSLVLLDLASGTPLWSIAGTGHEVRRMAFDAGGERLYVGGVDRPVAVHSVADGTLLEEWSAHGTIHQIELDPGRGRALVGGWWSLDEWSTPGGRRRARLGHPTECFRLAAGGEVLVTVGRGLLRTWEARVLEDPAPRLRARGRSAAVYLGKGELAAVGDEAGWLTLFEAASGAPRWGGPVLDRPVRALTPIRGGSQVLVAGQGGQVALVDTSDGAVLERFGPVLALTQGSLALHPDGRRVAYCEAPGSVLVRDLESGHVAARADIQCEARGIAWSPDGQALALIDGRRGLILLDAEGRELRSAARQHSLWGLCFAPDGRTLAASGWTGEVLIFDARTLELCRVLEGHTATAWDLSFRGGDSRHLFSTSGDGTIRLWDLLEKRCLFVLDELELGEALSVDVSSDGRGLLLAGSTGAVHTLDLFGADRCIAGNLAHQTSRLEREELLVGSGQELAEAVHAALARSIAR